MMMLLRLGIKWRSLIAKESYGAESGDFLGRIGRELEPLTTVKHKLPPVYKGPLIGSHISFKAVHARL